MCVGVWGVWGCLCGVCVGGVNMDRGDKDLCIDTNYIIYIYICTQKRPLLDVDTEVELRVHVKQGDGCATIYRCK